MSTQKQYYIKDPKFAMQTCSD